MSMELNIFVDENDVETGGKLILSQVRPEWKLENVKFKVRKVKNFTKKFKSEKSLIENLVIYLFIISRTHMCG